MSVFPLLQLLSLGRRAGRSVPAHARHRREDARNPQRQPEPLDIDALARALFEQAPVGRVFSDLDGRIVSANGAMAKLLGYREDELVGRPLLDLIAESDRQAALAGAEEVREGHRKHVAAIARCLHRDGHEIAVRAFTTLLRDGGGRPQCWATVVTDATDLDAAQLQVQRAHAASLATTERLRLLHSIATAANEAQALDDLASTVLRTTCVCFGWPAGALVEWVAGTATVRARHGAPELLAAVELAPPPGGRIETIEPSGQSLVRVPLAATGDDPIALMFATPDPTADVPRDDLALIAGECSRVLDRETAQRRLLASEASFRAVFGASPFPMSLTLETEPVLYAVNDALCQLVGRSPEELVGSDVGVFLHPEDAERARVAALAAATVPEGRTVEQLRFVHATGSVIPTEVTFSWVVVGDGARLLLAQTADLTARRTAEETLQAQAETDRLTGLANRFHLVRSLGEMGKDASGCAVLCINLDGFKLINDARGHDVGDEVLVEVAGRLHSIAGPDDLVARFGGDGFVIVCRTDGGESMGGPQDPAAAARRLADRVESALVAPIMTSSGRIHLSASIGISEGTGMRTTPLNLLQRADAAMYQAKRLGKDRRVVYDTRLHKRALEHRQVEAALRNALDEHRFLVHYQPIVDVVDARVVGVEALVRLLDEAGEIVPPEKFIAVAEQSGLIVPMGTWVMVEACRCIAALNRRLGRQLSVSVNVAARQAARADLIDIVTEALATAGLPPAALSLEITESALLGADEATMSQLNRMRKRGVQIGLDDFGTGYSSLTYLRQLPVSHLKVDRSFVTDMTTDRGNAAIVRAVTRLADDLGLYWVAEGVETTEQHRALTQLGPGFAQGYRYGRPVPVGELAGLLTTDSELTQP